MKRKKCFFSMAEWGLDQVDVKFQPGIPVSHRCLMGQNVSRHWSECRLLSFEENVNLDTLFLPFKLR